MYITNTKHSFITYQEIHNINTGSKPKFLIPSTDLTKFQKGLYYSEIKISNHPSSHVSSLSDDTKPFGKTLKHFHNSNSSYSIEDYFDFQDANFVLLGLSLILYKMGGLGWRSG